MDHPAEQVAVYNSIISTSIPLTIAFFWLLVFFVRHKSLRTLFFWEKLLGKGIVFSDKGLQQAWENQKELQQLSAVLPAIKYNNIYHAKNMQDWKEENKIGDSELSGLDDFFIYSNDYSSIKLKRAKTPSVFVAAVAFICFVILSIALFSVSFKSVTADAAIGKLKVNQELVWVYKDKVEEFSFDDNSWLVTLNEINDGDKLTEDAVKSIRKSISSGSIKKFYEGNKVATAVTSGFFFIVTFYFLIVLLRFIFRSDRVSKLCARVEYIQEQAGKNLMENNDEAYESPKCDGNNDGNKSD
jgi:hypothetical protein